MYPDDTDTIAIEGPPRAGRRRLMILLAVLVAATLALVGTLASGLGEEDDPAEVASAEVFTPAEWPVGEPIVLEEQPDPKPDPQTQPTGFPMGGGNQTGTMPGGPCPGVIGDEIIIKPNPVRLLGGQNKGAVDIRNCRPGKITWTASADKAWVQLAKTQDNLPSGATFRLLFTVHTASVPIGAYAFKIKISWEGGSTDVDVEGTKLGGLVAPGGPTPSPAPTIGGLVDVLSGCAVKCITKAWLTPIKGSANVSLEMKTNISTKMVVHLDTSAPKHDIAGKPYFTSPDVSLSNNDWRKQWNVTLKPLQPDTTYHIIVAAKDMQGGTAFMASSFKTAKPVDQLVANAPGGCSMNCINSALLTPKYGSPDFGIEVKAHVPVKMQVRANGAIAASTDGKYLAEWTSTLSLEPGQNYEIALKVTDQQGHSQEHKALVSTPKPAQIHAKPVRISFHKIYVTDDGDDSFMNRAGELVFRFEVNGKRLHEFKTAERKIRSPEWVDLGGRSVVVENPPTVLTFRVQGRERNGGRTNCTEDFSMEPETSGQMDLSCYHLRWNTAEGAIDLATRPAAGTLPDCHGFGFQADICYAVATVGPAPSFTVYVGIEFLD